MNPTVATMQQIIENAVDDLKRRGHCPECKGTGRVLDIEHMRLVYCDCQTGRDLRERRCAELRRMHQ